MFCCINLNCDYYFISFQNRYFFLEINFIYLSTVCKSHNITDYNKNTKTSPSSLTGWEIKHSLWNMIFVCVTFAGVHVTASWPRPRHVSPWSHVPRLLPSLVHCCSVLWPVWGQTLVKTSWQLLAPPTPGTQRHMMHVCWFVFPFFQILITHAHLIFFYYCVDFAVYIYILLLAIFYIAFVTADPSFWCPFVAVPLQIPWS